MSEAVDRILTKDVADKIVHERAELKVGAIGVGFAGSYNAQKLYESLGIPVYVINSSAKDLSQSVINKEIPSFLIGNEGRGAGNDRQKSKQLFKINGKELLTSQGDFLSLIGKSDILFVIFSSAGGQRGVPYASTKRNSLCPLCPSRCHRLSSPVQTSSLPPPAFM